MAKKTSPRRASKVKTTTSRQTIFQTFVAGFIVGVVCSIIGWNYWQTKSTSAGVARPSDNGAESVEVEVVEEKKPEIEITFPALLREAEVLVTVPPPEKPQKDVLYFLQAASFRDVEDANAARAELILLNLQVEISQSTLNGETWNRIIVGPFEGRSKVSKAQSTLLENGYGGMVLQREK